MTSFAVTKFIAVILQMIFLVFMSLSIVLLSQVSKDGRAETPEHADISVTRGTGRDFLGQAASKRWKLSHV